MRSLALLVVLLVGGACSEPACPPDRPRTCVTDRECQIVGQPNIRCICDSCIYVPPPADMVVGDARRD